MNPDRALAILREASAKAPMNLADHQMVGMAHQVLAGFINQHAPQKKEEAGSAPDQKPGVPEKGSEETSAPDADAKPAKEAEAATDDKPKE